MPLLHLLFEGPKRIKLQIPDASGITPPVGPQLPGLLGRVAGIFERTYLTIDATTSVTHNFDAEITENPVESGFKITDHVDVKPRVLNFQGIVSDAPISIEQAAIGNVAGAAPGLAGVGGINRTIATGTISAMGGLLFNQAGNRVNDALNALLALQEKKILCTIVTGLKSYSNMVLTAFTPTEEPRNGSALVFSATFKEIRVVQSTFIPVDKSLLDSAVSHTASTSVKNGIQASNPVNASVGSSWASTLLGVGAVRR